MRQVGFDLVGICPAVTPTGLSKFHAWLDAGYAGDMEYLDNRREAYASPTSVLEGARSIVVLGYKYADRSQTVKKTARISRYAWSGVDYHDVIHERLKTARKHFEGLASGFRFRGVVDTAPLLEREFAQMAGIGWQGKNTMLISKTDGSWFFLAALLTDMELEYDEPIDSMHCGTCTACLDTCPTDAFVEPFVLDGSKCISYFTIESRGLPPREFRPAMGEWLFGCDVCQEVCPWNRKDEAYIDRQEERILSKPDPQLNSLDLESLFDLDEGEFRKQFRKTPFWRAKRRGLLRNAAIILGNRGDHAALKALRKGAFDHEAVIRAACFWAIGTLGGPKTRVFLEDALVTERDELVRDEIKNQLNRWVDNQNNGTKRGD